MRKIFYMISVFFVSILFISSASALEQEDTLLDENFEEINLIPDISSDFNYAQSHEKPMLSDNGVNESSKIPTEIQLSYGDNIMVGQINRITVYNLPKDTKGKVFLYDATNEKNYTIDLVDGQGYLDLKMVLGSGTGDSGPHIFNYYLEAYFEGDDVYEASSVDAFLRVNKYYPNLQIHYKNIKAGEDAIIRFTLEKDAKGYVLLTVNKKDYSANVSDGEVSFILHGLAQGKYNMTAAYFGDEKYDWDYTSGVLDVFGNSAKKVEKISGNNYINYKSNHGLLDKTAGNPLILLLFSLAVIGLSLRR